MGYYDYKELRAAATAPGATAADVDALGAWFEQYGAMYWNGESYNMDDGKRLFPEYKETAPDEWEITGFSIR